MMTSAVRPKLFAPEVVQTSAMDCGPSALKCILEGFGISVSYGRLREACQTDLDGTSIDVMEEVANQLGLEAEQMMLPLDHLLLPGSDAFPSILVVKNPDGNTHFVVLWRRHGRLVQVMDPSVGRRWMTTEDLLAMTHTHVMPSAPDAWRRWSGSKAFLDGLAARQRRFGAGAEGAALIEQALRDPTWRSLAAVDAATRMVDALVRSGATDAGPPAARMLCAATETACSELSQRQLVLSIPMLYWSAGPYSPENGRERVLLRGAVIVRVRQSARSATAMSCLSPDLAAALTETPANPQRELARMIREDGLFTPVFVSGAAVVAMAFGGLEALVLRGLLDVALRLATWPQRVAAAAMLFVFFAALLGLELPLIKSMMSIGRKLEIRLRMAFLAKIPRLEDRYFHSRPTSDMTHRAHAIHSVRQLPALAFRLFRAIAMLLVTTAGLVWLAPSSWPIVVLAASLSVMLPLVMQSSLIERDLRVRAFHGALTRFYLDALLGLVAIRTHGADRSVRREHETMMGELRRSVRALLGAAVVVETLDAWLGIVLAAWLLFHYLGGDHPAPAALLLVYWALNVPVLGQEIAYAMRQYPSLRNLTLRLLEPLGAREDEDRASGSSSSALETGAASMGADVRLVSVTVRAAGKTILEGIDLHVPPGSHLAIVGSSGAGKSSLVGLLLGWHRAAKGEVLVDGAALRGEALARLRRSTAWVDPTVQLWNRSLIENLDYGAPELTSSLSATLETAGVTSILERLPEGLESSLGEGGALVSGGEGQRIRLARAMLRKESRLVVLDEPFRGLDRERRAVLVGRSRELWREATLFCVTHDVGDTLDFPRVIVVEDGRIVEDGPPRELAARKGSRYRALLDAEQMVQHGLWRSPSWRRLVLSGGRIEELHTPAPATLRRVNDR